MPSKEIIALGERMKTHLDNEAKILADLEALENFTDEDYQYWVKVCLNHQHTQTRRYMLEKGMGKTIEQAINDACKDDVVVKND